MRKRVILLSVAVFAIALGVVGMSAFEAHIINVTAKIENALAVNTEPIEFGTVFPQEYFTNKTFTVGLSGSFLDEGRVDDVEYVIKQKPKCECDRWLPLETDDVNLIECPDGRYLPVGYATHECPEGYTEMVSLCPFLSKTTEEGNDTSHPSYYNDPTPGEPNSGDESCAQPVHIEKTFAFSPTGWAGWSCPAGTEVIGGGVMGGATVLISQPAKPGVGTYPNYPHYNYTPPETGWVVQNDNDNETITFYVDCLAIIPDAAGMLVQSENDISDLWTVDLKVPPFKGYVGQDWPAGCPVLEGDPKGTDVGCDLWVEVTNISEPFCGEGRINGNEECESNDDCTAQPNGSCNPPGGPLECKCKYSVQVPDF